MVLQSIEDARSLGHVFSLTHALQRAGMTMMLLKDEDACRVIADELVPLAERNKFHWQWFDGVFMQGWLAAQSGNFVEGLEKMAYTIAQPFSATFLPTYLSLITDQDCRAGNVDKTLAWIARAFDAMRGDNNHFCEPEFYRLRGEALLAQSPANGTQGERDFREALALAGKQSCPTLALRAPAAWRGCCVTTRAPTKRTTCWRRSMLPSPKVSNFPICGRPRRCWWNWPEKSAGTYLTPPCRSASPAPCRCGGRHWPGQARA